MGDLGVVLLDLTVACTIMLCTVVTAVILARRREAKTHLAEGDGPGWKRSKSLGDA
jgi:hypothetical protein